MNLPQLQLIEADGVYRYFACTVPGNGCYVEKLLVLAMPDETDECPKVVGQLTITKAAYPESPGITDAVDWLEVEADHRQEGIARKMWGIAQRLLGRELRHEPVTKLGEKFATAMEATS